MSLLKLPPQMGVAANGDRLERMRNSPNFNKDRFRNPVETKMNEFPLKMLRASLEFARGGKDRKPNGKLPVQKLSGASFPERDPGSTWITWLGHSAILLEMQGKRILCDPMLGQRASPFSWSGPKRFDMDLPIELEDFPELDLIIISHDHYDHLDYGSIRSLHGRAEKIYCSLGVGAHLEAWGVPAAKITEFDWWDTSELDGLHVTAAPARHFSGRRGVDAHKTLWSSWAIRGQYANIFFGADSGYFPGFKTIGDRLGPFDLTMLECGAYGEGWPYIHMFPEQTAQAHIDLQGKTLLPIHWASFSLAPQPWTEPVERLLAAAKQKGVHIATPLIGERFELNAIPSAQYWWREFT